MGALRVVVKNETVENDSIVAMLRELAKALIMADVPIKLVATLRDNVKLKIQEAPAGKNKKKTDTSNSF